MLSVIGVCGENNNYSYNPPIEVKERQSERWRAFFTLIKRLYIKTIRINELSIDFHIWIKHLEKEEKYLNTLGMNPRGWISTKRGS